MWYQRAILLIVVCLSYAQAAEAPLSDGEEIFLVALQSNLLSELLNKPVLERSPISETVKNTTMRGTAVTQGNVTGLPLICDEAVAFSLVFNSSTNTTTSNTTDGRKGPGESGKSHPEVGASFTTNIATAARTARTIFFQERGITVETAPHTDAISSSLNYFGDLKVQTQGILPWRRFESNGNGRPYRVSPNGSGALPIPGAAAAPRIRARVAPPQVTSGVMAQQAKIEADASKQISEKLDENFAKVSKEEMIPIHQKYREYVFHPFITRNLLGGRIAAKSDGHWFAIQGLRGAELRPVSVSAMNGFDGITDPVLARLHPEFFERVLEMQFGGTPMTEVELAEMMGGSVPDEETLANVLGNPREEVLFVLDEKKPIRLRFENDRIRVTTRMQQASTQGKKLENISISREMVIETGEKGSLWLRSLAPEPVAFYDGTAVPGDLGKHVTARFASTLDRAPIELTKKVFLSSVKPMGVKTVRARDNRLVVGLAPVEGGVR